MLCLVILTDQLMARFGAKMRHIHNGCRVIGPQFYHLADRHGCQPFAQLEHRKGQSNPRASIVSVTVMLGQIVRVLQKVHNLVTVRPRDAGPAMD